MHKMSAALISPVSRWYQKPTPWWVDGFEEVGLSPIIESDEEIDGVYTDEIEEGEDVSFAGDVDIFVDAESLPKGAHIAYTCRFDLNMHRHLPDTASDVNAHKGMSNDKSIKHQS